MRKTLFEVAAAVAAALVAWLVLNVVGVQSGSWKWFVIAGVFVVAIVVAWLAGRTPSSAGARAGVEVGNRVKAQDVTVEDINTDAVSGNVSIANDINAKRAVDVKKIRVKKPKH